jgi:3D (Asp-Asp-Asp) domain-containing protein
MAPTSIRIVAVTMALAFGGTDLYAQICVNAPGKKSCGVDATRSMVPSRPVSRIKSACTVPGVWTTSFGTMTVRSDLTGTFVVPYCPIPVPATITLQGPNAFSVRLTWTGDPGVCQSSTAEMAFTSADCNTAEGTYVNDDGGSGDDTWTRKQIDLSLSRSSLRVVDATGSPSGGTFSYAAQTLRGTSVAGIKLASGVSEEDNPNTANLTNPANPNSNLAPAPGGLARMTATYTLPDGGSTSKQFSVPTFGLSCYYTASEVDWGTPPKNCTSITIKPNHYKGTVTNPLGFPGTYCSSFIAELKLQGSAYARDGRILQYDPARNKISVVTEIDGADNTPVVAGQTLARDPAVIPRGGVRVDLSRGGTGLLANDTGGKIVGYRIDLYRGSGASACSGFSNIITIAACVPGNTKCPSSDLQ